MSKMKKVLDFKLLSLIAAIVIVAGVLLAALLGFNADVSASGAKTLTVRIFATETDHARVDAVRAICDKEIDGKLAVTDTYVTRISQDTELVYVFDENEKTATVQAVKNNVQARLDAAKAEAGNALYSYDLNATANVEKAKATISKGYIWRAILAASLVIVAEFVYVAIRFKLNMGIAAAISSFVGTALTVAIVALVRIPVTTAVAYAGAFALLYTTATTLLVLAKQREALKNEEKGADPAETVANAVPAKELLIFAGALAVALVLIGAIATAAVRWFALTAFVGLISGMFASLLFLPSVYLPLKKSFDKRAAERARYDYKKGAKKDKKEKAIAAPEASEVKEEETSVEA